MTTVQALVTSKATAQMTGTRNNVSNGYMVGAVITSAIHAVTRGFTGGLGAERSNGVTVNVRPVFGEPALYASYINFLNLEPKGFSKDQAEHGIPAQAADSTTMKIVSQTTSVTKASDGENKPTGETTKTETVTQPPAPTEDFPEVQFGQIHSLQETAIRPGEGSYIARTLRRWGDHWYFIPVEYKREFSRLCLAVVARGVGGPTVGVASHGSTAATIRTLLKDQHDSRTLDEINAELMRNNVLSETR